MFFNIWKSNVLHNFYLKSDFSWLDLIWISKFNIIQIDILKESFFHLFSLVA